MRVKAAKVSRKQTTRTGRIVALQTGPRQLSGVSITSRILSKVVAQVEAYCAAVEICIDLPFCGNSRKTIPQAVSLLRRGRLRWRI